MLTGKKEIAVLLIRLLLLEQGANPLYPNMGIDIVRRYRYGTEKDLDGLRKDITSQVNTYMPEYQQVQTELSIDSATKGLNIKITIDDTAYNFTTTESTDPVVVSLSNYINY